ncbi:hypothetical protein EIP86_010943 [Pleurotus ostreatoroseus]|nr:hypothetical protein EIP86_010943 [Pleurotus ostreatoroseus]
MSSDESSSSGTLSKKVQKKSHDKGKKKDKSQQPSVVVTPHGKNEGTDTDWAYKPPKGAVLASYAGDAGEFDWDALKNNEDVELWIVRVPDGVKAKHLQGLKLDTPSSSKTARIGSLSRKHAAYDVWSLGEDSNDLVGAEESKNFSCILPRKKKGGKLYTGALLVDWQGLDPNPRCDLLAPEITTRHIVLSARPDTPSSAKPTTEDDDMSWSTLQNPPRPAYPKELLKHRFMPYGSLAPPKDAVEAMDVDEQQEAAVPATHEIASPSKKHKRRKEDDGSPKKPKKSKIADK